MADETISDADLARRCRQGDAAAWRILIARCSPLVYRVGLQMLRNPCDAEDVAQEVFMRIHRSFTSFDPTRPLAPWVSRITYNTCLKRLQGAAARNVATDPSAFAGLRDEDQAGPERQTAARETSALVQAAMDHLSAQDRALMTLRYREGLTDVEIAEAVGMAVGTVKTRLHRARATLRQRLVRQTDALDRGVDR